jgi:hypothetical protein
MQLTTLRSGISGRLALHYALRWVLGLTLVATSAGKALDISGFHDVLKTYEIFPVWMLWLLAVAMPVLEAGIAWAMLTGKRLSWGILGSLLLHSSFTVLLTVELARGVHLENCGCFGVFLARPLVWYTPLEDVALLAITLGIVLTNPARTPRR